MNLKKEFSMDQQDKLPRFPQEMFPAEVLRGVSFESRNLIVSIQLMTDFYAYVPAEKNDRVDKYIETIQTQTKRLHELFEAVEDYLARIDGR